MRTSGPLKGVAQPLRFDGERPGQRLAPPLCGEHTAEILREAGCSDEQIAAMLVRGIASQQAGA